MLNCVLQLKSYETGFKTGVNLVLLYYLLIIYYFCIITHRYGVHQTLKIVLVMEQEKRLTVQLYL